MSHPKGSVFSRSVLPGLAFFALGLPLLAQSAIDRAVVSGGSGTSTAGCFSLDGRIGQAIPGTQTGGACTLTACFWSLVTTVSTSNAPALCGAWVVNGSGPKLIWAMPVEGWVLQQTAVLAGSEPKRVPVDGAYIDTGTESEVTVGVPSGQRFFRLHKWFSSA